MARLNFLPRILGIAALMYVKIKPELMMILGLE